MQCLGYMEYLLFRGFVDAMSGLYGVFVVYGLCLIQCHSYMEYLLCMGFV